MLDSGRLMNLLNCFLDNYYLLVRRSESRRLLKFGSSTHAGGIGNGPHGTFGLMDFVILLLLDVLDTVR